MLANYLISAAGTAASSVRDLLRGALASSPQVEMLGIPSRFLSYWLIGAASLRMLSVFIGVLNPDTFKKRVYRLRPDYVNPLLGRTFSAWTLVTCMLCVLTAFRMEQEPTLYLATLGSFGVAFLKFAAEYFVYKTVDMKGFMSPLVISSVSIVWMAAGWGTYASY